LRNPLSADLSELRTSLIPSLLEVVRRNRAVGERDVQIFEIGRTYGPGGEGGLALEQERLGIVLSGHLGGDGWTGEGLPGDFSTLAGVVDGLLARLGIAATRRAERDTAQLHPGRSAALMLGDTRLGVLGELHPGLAATFELDGPVAVAELDLAALVAAVPELTAFAGLSSFPPVRQDIAVIVADDIDAAALIATARAAGGELLQGVEVFDVFADPERVGAARVSIALRLVFQADDRTLTDDEATAAREQIVGALVASCGAELRG
jgi:phenylalanyl-tRNA synthetase beta chain